MLFSFKEEKEEPKKEEEEKVESKPEEEKSEKKEESTEKEDDKELSTIEDKEKEADVSQKALVIDESMNKSQMEVVEEGGEKATEKEAEKEAEKEVEKKEEEVKKEEDVEMKASSEEEEKKPSTNDVELTEEKKETETKIEPTETESKVEEVADKEEEEYEEVEEEIEEEVEEEEVKKEEPPVDETFTSTNAVIASYFANNSVPMIIWPKDRVIYNRLEQIIAMFEANGEWPQPPRPLQPPIGTPGSFLAAPSNSLSISNLISGPTASSSSSSLLGADARSKIMQSPSMLMLGLPHGMALQGIIIYLSYLTYHLKI